MRASLILWRLLAVAVAYAALHPPKDFGPIESKLSERRKALEQRLRPALKVIVEVEERVGLRDESGRRLRPTIPNPATDDVPNSALIDVSFVDMTVLEALRKRQAFDQRVLAAFSSLPNGDAERYAKAGRAYLAAQKEVHELSEQAISLAQNTFGIDPLPAGKVASGPPPGTPFGKPSFIGQQASGVPTFNENVREGVKGQTNDAAHIEIGPDAFSSPGRLGATIYHEGLHYRDYLTPGLDLRNEPANEVRVRAKLRPLLRRIFNFSQADLTDNDKVQAQYKKWASDWSIGMSQGHDPYSRIAGEKVFFPFPSVDRYHYSGQHFASLASILDEHQTEQNDEQDVAIKSLDDAVPARDSVSDDVEREQAKADAERKAQEAIEAARDPQWDALSAWVGAACRYLKPVEFVPGGAGSSSPDFSYIKWAYAENDRRASSKLSSDAVDRDYLLAHSVVMPTDAMAAGLKAHKKSLDSCERDMLKLLISAPAPLQTEWLVGRLDDRKGGGALGRFVRGISKDIKKGSAVLVSGITVSLIAVGEAVEEMSKPAPRSQSTQSQPNAPDREKPFKPEPPERQEPRSSSGAWNGSYAYGQLGGVASGSLHFH